MWVRIQFVQYMDVPCHPVIIGELIRETDKMLIIGREAYQTEGYDETTGQYGIRWVYSKDAEPSFISKQHVLRIDTLAEPPQEGFTPYKDGDTFD